MSTLERAIAFAPIRQLYSSLAEIKGNIAYIRKELPTLTIPLPELSRINKVCEGFEGAVYDVRKEIRNLEDKLGMHPGEEPVDPDIVNPDPRVTIGFVERWLRPELFAMHDVVEYFEKLKDERGDVGCVYLLVSESAVNIHNAYSSLHDSLRDIEAHLLPKEA